MRPIAILVATGLTAGYGGAPVINDVCLEVGEREIVSVVGPNGSGKSTLLKAMIGAVALASGSVLFKGTEVGNWATEDLIRTGIGYVPQVDDVFGAMTVLENLEMGGYLLSNEALKERVPHVLDLFPALRKMLNRPADKLSGGERKMLAMGRVLMLKPSLFILDEPTANLAPAVAQTLLHEHIRSLTDTGAAVLLVEQRARSALEISDWTYVMGGGRCHVDGSSADLAARPDFADAFLGGASTAT